MRSDPFSSVPARRCRTASVCEKTFDIAACMGVRMKLRPKVVWAEGMHLAPHHFQAQSRYFEDSIHFATAGLWTYAYGFSDFQLDYDALRNGTVSLLSARGVFEDGLPFDLPECDPLPATINITERFPPTADSLSVALAVPRWVADAKNCAVEGEPEPQLRYRGVLESLPDENTGRDDKPVRLGRKNIRLVPELDASEDLLTLPLAQIVRDGSGRFVYDPAYIATSVQIGASECLNSMLGRIVEILEEKSVMVSRQQHQTAGRFQAGMSARDVSQFWFLHAVNSSLTPLRHLLLSKPSHPEGLFHEMARLAGALCTFEMGAHPASLPNYDHWNPGPGFLQIDSEIRRLLEVVV